jgi:hypothetical protein
MFDRSMMIVKVPPAMPLVELGLEVRHAASRSRRLEDGEQHLAEGVVDAVVAVGEDVVRRGAASGRAVVREVGAGGDAVEIVAEVLPRVRALRAVAGLRPDVDLGRREHGARAVAGARTTRTGGGLGARRGRAAAAGATGVVAAADEGERENSSDRERSGDLERTKHVRNLHRVRGLAAPQNNRRDRHLTRLPPDETAIGRNRDPSPAGEPLLESGILEVKAFGGVGGEPASRRGASRPEPLAKNRW